MNELQTASGFIGAVAAVADAVTELERADAAVNCTLELTEQTLPCQRRTCNHRCNKR